MTKQFQSQMETIKVKVDCLDNMNVAQNNLFLKIDIEGHEFPAIRGAKKILHSANNIAILFEYSFGWLEAEEDIRDCFQFLNEAGYSFYKLIPFGLEEVRFLTIDMTNIQYCNYVATKGASFAEEKTLNVATPFGTNRIIQL